MVCRINKKSGSFSWERGCEDQAHEILLKKGSCVTYHPEPERPAQRGVLRPRLLSLLCSALLLAAGVWAMNRRVEWYDAVSIWSKLDPTLIAAVLLLTWLQYPINAYRLQRVIGWITGRPWSDFRFKFIFKLTCSASFITVATPVGLAADAAKIAVLRLFGSLSMTDAARCVLFDRVVGVQWLCLVGLALLSVQMTLGVDRSIIFLQLVLLGGLLASVAALLVFPRVILLLPFKRIKKVAQIFTGYRPLLFRERLPIQLALSLVNSLLSWLSLYLLIRAAGLDANSWIIGAFIPLLQLVNGLPFLYLGWGGRELAMVATLGGVGGLTVNNALAVSVAWGVVLTAISAVNGLFLLGDWQSVAKRPP
jgi:glycosyltransferase 2 family protein